MSPALYIEHGNPVMKLSERPVEIIDGFDTLDVTWQTPERDAFRLGHAPPDYPHMKIVEREPQRDGPVWQHRMRCEGILGHLPYKLLPRRENSPHEGFDEIEQPLITRQPHDSRWARGTQLPDIATMWIVDITRAQHRARGFYDQSLIYKGIMEGKPAKRRMGTQTFSWSGDEIENGLIEQSVYGWPPQPGGFAFGAWGSRKWEVDQPGTSVSDVLITLSPPPTWLVPGFWVPPNPPPIKLVPFVASEAPVFYWPYGWQVSNMQSEQILDKACWLLSITWSTKPQSTPGGKASNIIRL